MPSSSTTPPAPGRAYFDVDSDSHHRHHQNSNSSSRPHKHGKNERHSIHPCNDYHHDDDHHDDDDDKYDEGMLTLTWRGDPGETHSDYSITVVTSELRTVTYHVHKSVMCFGLRQSRYFARVMLNNTSSNSRGGSASKRKQQQHGSPMLTTTNSGTPCVKIELDQRDADNFPLLLDYMYEPSTNLSKSHDETLLTAASTFASSSAASSTLFAVPTSDSDDQHQQRGTGDGVMSIPGFDSILDEPHQSSSMFQVMTTSNAVSLRYLAKRFEVNSFLVVVNRFIQRDLNFKTGPAYLSTAWEYKDERLVSSAQRLCAENFEQLDSHELTKLPLKLFQVVVKSLESFDQDNKQLSIFLSDAVCEYIESNPDTLSAEVLLQLTDPIVMPYIGADSAIGFTALVKELDSHDATNHWDGLVKLCRRCAKSVVQEYGWNDFCVNAAVDEYLGHISGTHTNGSSTSITTTNSRKQGDLKQSQQQSQSNLNKQRVSRIDSLLFATSFASALEQAQDDYEEISVEQERLEKTVEALFSTISLMDTINEKKDEHMTRQQQVIDEAKKQIHELKQQIQDIKQHQHSRLEQPRPRERHQHAPGPSSTIRDGLTPEEIVRDLKSPSAVLGRTILAPRTGGKNSNNHSGTKKQKQQQQRELQWKEEMRSHSLLP